MKQVITFLTLVLLTSTLANAQSAKQVKWAYSVKKLGDKTYEVSMSASLGSKYHLYAQDAGAEGPLPTTFVFTKNPLVSFEGNVKEEGKLIKKKEEVWGGVVNYYENSVVFKQVIKLKSNIKTNIAGKVSFIVCNDRECLAPSDVDFSVAVGG